MRHDAVAIIRSDYGCLGRSQVTGKEATHYDLIMIILGCLRARFAMKADKSPSPSTRSGVWRLNVK